VNILVESLSDEAIENVITSLNFEFDKVIFFGYENEISRHKKTTEEFLKSICGVKFAEFYEVEKFNLAQILEKMRSVISAEVENNEIFFDLTGGDDLILLVFGELVKEFSLNLHIFDIKKYYYHMLAGKKIDTIVKRRKIRARLKDFIPLQGGSINFKMFKEEKQFLAEKSYFEEVERLWAIMAKHSAIYNRFSNFLKSLTQSGLKMSVARGSLTQILNRSKVKEAQMLQILGELCEAGLLKSLNFGEILEFEYKDENIKNSLKDAGSVLELKGFYEVSSEFDECLIGVHVDWDGMETKVNVLNEIDILGIRGGNLTFISCKSGSVDQMALYELDTVARKIGGKYAKKRLFVTKPLGKSHMMRAKDLGIEVKVLKSGI